MLIFKTALCFYFYENLATISVSGTTRNSHAGYLACSCIDGFYRKDRFGQCYRCPSIGVICKNGTLFYRMDIFGDGSWRVTKKAIESLYRTLKTLVETMIRFTTNSAFQSRFDTGAPVNNLVLVEIWTRSARKDTTVHCALFVSLGITLWWANATDVLPWHSFLCKFPWLLSLPFFWFFS